MKGYFLKGLVCFVLLGLLAGLVSAASNPTKYDLSAAEKSQIVQWLNTASAADLTASGLSLTAVTKIQKVRPFAGWDAMWATTSVGSDANAKRIMIHLGLYTEIQDRYITKACIRTRPYDRSKIVSWLNNASANDLIRISITLSGQAKIMALRPFANWKAVLLLVSDNDIRKVGVEVGAVRYVSGSKAIELISGIGTVYGGIMRSHKIFSVQTLLMHSVWPSWRAELATKTGISQTLIDKWAKRADLFRISGAGEQYGDLLAYAGVESVADLKTKDPVALRNKMIEMNATYNLVTLMPSQTTITGWVNKAKALPKILE